MRTCRGRFQISRTAGPIALKFGTRHRLVVCRAKVTLDPGCTCALAGCRFQVSGTAGSIASKFGTPLVTGRSQLKVPSHPSARAGLTLSLARSSPQRRFTGRKVLALTLSTIHFKTNIGAKTKIKPLASILSCQSMYQITMRRHPFVPNNHTTQHQDHATTAIARFGAARTVGVP